MYAWSEQGHHQRCRGAGVRSGSIRHSCASLCQAKNLCFMEIVGVLYFYCAGSGTHLKFIISTHYRYIAIKKIVSCEKSHQFGGFHFCRGTLVDGWRNFLHSFQA